MFPALCDLLAAERQLGRLTQAVADDAALAEIKAFDAARREVLASLALDGSLVHLEDLAAGVIDLGLVPGPMVHAVARGAALLTADAMMRRGLHDATPAPVAWDAGVATPGAAPAADEAGPGLATAAAIADLDAFLATLTDEPDAPSPPLSPLSQAWMTKAWTLAFGPPDTATVAAIAAATVAVDEALSARPGVAGVAMALRRLHGAGLWPEPSTPTYDGLRDDDQSALADALALEMAERRRAGHGWAFARLIAPWLIGRACGLDGPGPGVSCGLALHRVGYAVAVARPLDDWTAWLARALANGWAADRRRLDTLRALLATWRAKLGDKRRPSRGPARALPLLIEQPVVVPAWLAQRMGLKLRAAQLVLAELQKAGVARETTGRYCHRVWLAVGG